VNVPIALYVGLLDYTHEPSEYTVWEVDVSTWWPAIPRIGDQVATTVTLSDGTERTAVLVIDEVQWRTDVDRSDVWLGTHFKEWEE
jgi:hypothetical protein